MTTKIASTPEHWEDRSLGADTKFSAKDSGADAEAVAKQVDEALGLKMISIRLPEQLIDDFKTIAAVSGGMGYQTLMRQVMKRFVNAELKRLAREAMTQPSAAPQRAVPVSRSQERRKRAA